MSLLNRNLWNIDYTSEPEPPFAVNDSPSAGKHDSSFEDTCISVAIIGDFKSSFDLVRCSEMINKL